MDYPYGASLEWRYENPDLGGADGVLSRVAEIDPDTGVSDDEFIYKYVGAGTIAIVDFATPDARLDRFAADNGTDASGTYEGLDRYGRVKRHRGD